jgi:16S rRNA (cytidine1402-2'-O)-methyltransferase
VTELAKGTLHLCGTPIGNLEDVSQRLLRVLTEVSLIAAEDTRLTQKLLSHFGIKTPMVSYHEHNERTRGPELIERLLGGSSVAVVTDAGMPGISDPGEYLVALAVENGIRVEAVPGPVAAVSALICSGLPAGRFAFEGFLPRGKKERTQALDRISREDRTLVIYEAPHRLLKTLKDLAPIIGDRRIAVARELTKRFEEIRRGTTAEHLAHFEKTEPRGEFTLVIEGADPVLLPDGTEISDPVSAVRRLEAEGVPRKEALKEVASKMGRPKRDLYRLMVESREEEPDDGPDNS